ncbi:hypothetical protein N7478_013251 [Penicillium angulare]|uniref:uncharacterized protein n=1 Tax=Penicillium angulare TaxID=116970 RepID=UPI00254043E2|nr:uncharacterized protein N7478_013251 [Penicillium angulare]KAJ5257147.1 hypothetical protein N7478_013251 [Penicillium angulare]
MGSGPPGVAKRQQYRRHSRYGCRNCKLRKVKCDEARPQCLRCRAYGVQCTFTHNTTDLQPLLESREQNNPKSNHPDSSPRASITNGIWAEDGMSFFNLNSHDWGLFNKFRYRTVYSLGGDALVHIHENHMLKASFSCPFLLHGILALTAVHDRYLEISSKRRSLIESHHWSECTTLFNKWLGHDIKEEQKDPIWAATGILNILAFSSINASSPSDAWPQLSQDSSDLEWLSLGTGKMKLWNLINPLRPGSVFRAMCTALIQMRAPLPIEGTEGTSKDLVQLCRMGDTSTQENNSYFQVVHGLSRLLRMPQGTISIGNALMICNYMHGQFEVLLMDKDPIALLLLGLWYAKARGVIWWIDFRARYEIPSICNYLQRHYGGNNPIQALIPWDGIIQDIK